MKVLIVILLTLLMQVSELIVCNSSLRYSKIKKKKKMFVFDLFLKLCSFLDDIPGESYPLSFPFISVAVSF